MKKIRKSSVSVSPRGKISLENEAAVGAKKRGRPRKLTVSPNKEEVKKKRGRLCSKSKKENSVSPKEKLNKVEKNFKRKKGPQSKDTNQTKSPETGNSRPKKLGKGKEKSGNQRVLAQKGDESQMNISVNKKYLSPDK